VHCCAQESARATLASRSTLTCLVRSSFHPRDPVKGSRASAVARSPCPARPQAKRELRLQRTLHDGRETRSVDVSNPHRLIFSKTSTHVSCSYPACAGRCLRFTPPAPLRRVQLGSGCSVEHPGCDSSRSLDTDVLFPCRPSGTDPLTTRHLVHGKAFALPFR
jgi:hypothetical protein